MNTIGQLNAVIYRNMQILIGNKLTDLKLRSGQYDFFLVIYLQEGITQKELSEHLRIGKSTTAKAVKYLVQNGYVVKEKDEKDGRVEHLYLSEMGRKQAPAVEQIFEESVGVAAKGLSDSELEQLSYLMNKVMDNLVSENKLMAEGEKRRE